MTDLSTFRPDDSLKPDRERLVESKIRQMPVGFDKRFLRSVLREMEVSEDCVPVTNGHILETAHDLPESIHITATRPLYQYLQVNHVDTHFV